VSHDNAAASEALGVSRL